MQKFWVRANAKHNFPHDATVVAVYGTIKDARKYAYDYMGTIGITVVQIFDADMDELETFEF